MASITLPCGSVVLFDEEDAALVSSLSWRINGTRRSHAYAVSQTAAGAFISMHRLIMAAKVGLVVDHINGNGLDNRRCNLRIATRAENSRNRKPTRGRPLKGVQNRRGRFHAQLTVGGEVMRFGGFETETEAAVAYDKAAIEHHGAFARLNFDPKRDWLFPYSVADKAGRIGK